MLNEDLAKMKEEVSLLDRNHNQADPWQVQLTDQMIPRLQTIEGSIDRALVLLDRTTGILWAPNYETTVGDIRDQATGLARTIDAFLIWASNEDRRN